MHCPRCQDQVLDVKERDGVTLDACLKCRGLWLDRGELEKLIARATVEADEERRAWASRDGDGRPRRYDEDRRDGPDRRYDDEHRHLGERDHDRYRKKRSWFENLGEIFD